MPTRKLYIPIAGTWARRGAKTTSWYRRRSSFDARLRGMGYERVEQDRGPDQGRPRVLERKPRGDLISSLQPQRVDQGRKEPGAT